MNKYKLTLTYDGTNYSGWQIQPNATSIQTIVQQALNILLKTPTYVIGSGRTDAGVHALNQVAHFSFDGEIDLRRLLISLNGLLPHDIRIKKIDPVAEDFHARYSATGKIYHYHLHLDRILNPFKRLYSFHVLHRVDLKQLKEGASFFVGTHDFTSFANEAHSGSASRGAIRTLKRLDVIEEEGGVRLEFEADGFLYKMVRNITGTLLDLSSGKISLDALAEIFAAKDRRKASKTVPPQGLFLVEVLY